MKKFLVLFSSFIFATLLSACSGFFDKDNTPPPAALTDYRPEIEPRMLWSARVGSGANDSTIRLTPAIAGSAIYVASTDGTVASLNRMNGQINWAVNTHLPLTTGPGVGSKYVVVGSQRGKLIALSAVNGRQLWETNVSGELLANPALSRGVVVVKTMDGIVRGLDLHNGNELWSYQLSEPSLLLRGASSPLVIGNVTVVGFANGKLAKLNLRNGNQEWLQTIALPKGAFSIQRMIDIDADPVAYGEQIYAATYQGQIAALDWYYGQKRWTHDLSSYTGMTADHNAIYVSDADSHLWSFDAADGGIKWQQNQLTARGITGPAIIGHYLAVGDAQGYLHWVNAKTGRLAARDRIGSSITATPIARNGVIYVYTNNGNLVAYVLDPARSSGTLRALG